MTELQRLFLKNQPMPLNERTPSGNQTISSDMSMEEIKGELLNIASMVGKGGLSD